MTEVEVYRTAVAGFPSYATSHRAEHRRRDAAEVPVRSRHHQLVAPRGQREEVRELTLVARLVGGPRELSFSERVLKVLCFFPSSS